MSRRIVALYVSILLLLTAPVDAWSIAPQGWGGSRGVSSTNGYVDLEMTPGYTPVAKGPVDRYDPWERLNRRIYRFNANFDKYVFLPGLKAWRFATPSFFRRGLSNALANVNQIVSLVNSILQLSPTKTVGTVSRIIVNSTIGIGGLLDPATGIGLVDYREDFGQTLGKYRVPAGPFLVLPVLGPSSLRDTGGMIVDRAYMSYLQSQVSGDFFKDHPWVTVPIGVVVGLQARDDNPFRYGELGPFEYDLIRYFYLEHRKAEIKY